MSEPTLNKAIVALRATHGDPSESEVTLDRIQSSLDARRPHGLEGRILRLPARRTLQAAALALLGLTLATTSYAAFFGLPAALRPWLAATRTSERPAATPERSRRATREPPGDAALQPPGTGGSAAATSAAPAQLAPPTSHVARSVPALRRPRISSARAKLAAAQHAASQAQAEREQLYREAHRLHFVVRDYNAALAAWDRYLGVAADAPLAVDARYHRALCLVHLGIYVNARKALEPIARGEAGAYRQREARALLLRIP